MSEYSFFSTDALLTNHRNAVVFCGKAEFIFSEGESAMLKLRERVRAREKERRT